MGVVFTVLSVALLVSAIVLLCFLSYRVLLKILAARQPSAATRVKKNYFYLMVSAVFPLFFLAAEGVLKWKGNSKELNSFWVVGTISAAIGLTLGNVKPKEFIASPNVRPNTRVWHTERDEFKSRDESLIGWCWLLTFLKFGLWMYAVIAVEKKELPDFLTTLIGVMAVYSLSIYMSYRKELL